MSLNTSKIRRLSIQKSLVSSPQTEDDWILLQEDEYPEWIRNNDEILERLANGEMVINEQENDSHWYKAVTFSITSDDGRQLVVEYFDEIKDTLKADDSELGQKKLLNFVENDINRWWLYRIVNGEDPHLFPEIKETLYKKLAFIQENSEFNPYAHSALLQIIESMKEKNISLPEDLDQWHTKLLKGESSKPRQHGPSKYSNIGRDLHIAWAIYILELQGIKPTRNDASNSTNSGCDIVSEVLVNRIGISLSYEGVRNIWKKYSNLQTSNLAVNMP